MTHSRKIALRTDYVIETATTSQVVHQERPGFDLTIHPVTRAEFIDLFNTKKEANFADNTLPAGEYWDKLFGNDTSIGGKENNEVCYLTEESAHLLIEYYDLFYSGIDFYNLPRGFVLVKNPMQNGLRNVLHYSAYLAKIDTKNRALAIELSHKNPPPAASSDHGFPNPQAQWYELLRSKIQHGNQVFCTEDELKKAFITFSSTINAMELQFYAANFHELYYQQSAFNPIVMLGRWNVLLTQAHLKKEDRLAQWQALPQLELAQGHTCIRALLDYRSSLTPCGFVLPEMRPEDTTWTFINTLNNPKDIQTENDFWRYIAYQPKRNSIEFYRNAVNEIMHMNVSLSRKIELLNILAGSTTARAHDASNADEEAEELEIWTSFCTLINTVTDGTPTLQFYTAISGDPNRIREDYVDHMHRIQEYPNIPMLRTVADTISLHLNKLTIANITTSAAMRRHPLQALLNLSAKINDLTHQYGTTFYDGAKFYFVNRVWEHMDLTSYLELQHNILVLMPRDLQIFAPYLSTFNIREPNDLNVVPNNGLAHLAKHEFDNFNYILHFFDDAIHPRSILDIVTIYNFVRSIPATDTSLLNTLNWVAEQFGDSFPENYFEKKRKYLIDAQYGLNDVQKNMVIGLRLADIQTEALLSIESALLISNNTIQNSDLEELNEALLHFCRIFSEADVTDFLVRLESIRANLPKATRPLIDLINLLSTKKSLEGFNQIYFRNKIEKCQDDTLIHKFIVYIDALKPLGIKLGQISALMVQDLLAAITLNCHSQTFYNKDFFDNIKKILALVEEIGNSQPQIADLLLDVYYQCPNKNTPTFLPIALELTRCIHDLSQLFQSGTDEKAQNDMITLYTLMTNFHNKPQELMELMQKIRALTNQEQKKFVINLINTYIADNKSLQGLDEFLQSLATDDNFQKIVEQYCQYPPYPSFKQINQWIKNKNYDADFKAFIMRPFNNRILENAFAMHQYYQQKAKFIGVDPELFTDELPLRLNKQLNENRKRTNDELRGAFTQLKTSAPALTPEQKVELLCICIEMLARTTWQLHPIGKFAISQEVNTTQVMALYSMLMSDSTHVINEIDTGEGKSRIMMIMAACNAACGKTVDFLTSDMQLAGRDFLTYSAFFKNLNIRTSLITLDTPKQLYQKGGVNFTDYGQLLLLRNKSDIDGDPHAYLDENPKNRCLQVDEIDKFMHDKSQDSYNFAQYDERLKSFTWVYPYLVDFVKNHMDRYPDDAFDPAALTDSFVDYIAYSQTDTERVTEIEKVIAEDKEQIITWLQSAYLAWNRNIDDDYKVTEDSEDKLFCVRDMDGLIHYTRKILVLDNGRPVDKSTFADGVHQCLAAIENKKAGREDFVILPENVTKRSMYPISFMGHYHEGSILGTTGTSRRDAPTADADINYEQYTYIKIPRQKSLRRQDKNAWPARGADQQFEFIKKAMIEKLNQDPPAAILLICKNDLQSEWLYNKIAKDPALQFHIQQSTRVHALTEKQDEIAAVREAGTPGRVTVSNTGMFSRGVDIHAANLLVISTYVPTIEDEIQIKGRTGRFGKDGEYRMIPDMLDPDCPIDGNTYNVHNQIDQLQKQMALSSVNLEEICKLYAEFLEKMHQAFLAKPERLLSPDYLLEWNKFLSKLQKDWNFHKQPLLDAVQNDNQEQFIALFNQFTNKWEQDALTFIKDFATEDNSMQPKAQVIFKALEKQQGFFTHKPLKLKVQAHYDFADDGQARIYSTLFAQTIALLKGERQMFANYRAAQEGRGVLFADLKATLNGDRPLFANLQATIMRLIALLKRWLRLDPNTIGDLSNQETGNTTKFVL